MVFLVRVLWSKVCGLPAGVVLWLFFQAPEKNTIPSVTLIPGCVFLALLRGGINPYSIRVTRVTRRVLQLLNEV